MFILNHFEVIVGELLMGYIIWKLAEGLYENISTFFNKR